MIPSPRAVAIEELDEKVVGSTLPLHLVLVAVRFCIQAATSLRAASIATAIANDIFGPQHPHPGDAIGLSHNSVQNMILRIGLHEITRPKEFVSDRIWIVDHTISIGTTKCFLVLGIRQEHFRQLGRPLEHQDMHVLALIPVERSNGEIVHGQFKELAEKFGVPKCILSDHGSDLKKGSELFRRENPGVLICYDIVHAVSRMMQRILSRDKRWDDYRKACCQCANLTRQSGMSHLKPPKPKTKARYMNVDPEIDWGVKVLTLLHRTRRGSLDANQQQELPLKKMEERFGWLDEYVRPLALWWLLCKICQTACSVVRRHGYSKRLGEQMRAAIAVPKNETAADLVNAIYEFSDGVAGQFDHQDVVPGSSEIIESVIGKGKRLLGYQSPHGMTRQILAMATSVVDPTADFVREALRSCRIKHVAQWCQKHLPKSIQAHRIRDLGKGKTGTKPAQLPKIVNPNF